MNQHEALGAHSLSVIKRHGYGEQQVDSIGGGNPRPPPGQYPKLQSEKEKPGLLFQHERAVNGNGLPHAQDLREGVLDVKLDSATALRTPEDLLRSTTLAMST